MKHYNTGLTKNAIRRFNMKGETLEPEVMDQIVPVVHLREDNDVVISSNALNGNVSVSVSSYGLKGDLYLRGVLLSFAKDAAEDSTLLTFQYSSEEGTKFFYIPLVTGAAASNSVFITLDRVKVNTDTALSFVLTGHSAGNIRIAMSAIGYLSNQKNT